MSKGKSSISKAQSYEEIGEFWDTHDLADYWDKTHPVEFEIDIQSEITYYPLENALSEKVRSIARQQGVPPEILLRFWIQKILMQTEIGQVYCVKPDVGGGWAIEKRNAEQALIVYRTKQKAVAVAKEIAWTSEPSLLVVYKKDGTIQNVHFYGKVPRKVLHRLPIQELEVYRKLLVELEELESIRAYDAAKASGEESVPYGSRIELIPVKPIKEMRGFLKGIDTKIERESDRI